MSVFEPLLYSQIVILIFYPVDFFFIILIDLKNPAAHREENALFFKYLHRTVIVRLLDNLGTRRAGLFK